ncbi:MAG: pentapeptide repeat-containing protein [Richelia sp. RM2_1_2]|nr:pentapeptide repeat-containing protein [Richelia sp. RM2_1_2]
MLISLTSIFIDVNLFNINLRGANLRGANLRGANLGGANFSGANVKNAQFRDNQGISEEMRYGLTQRGAIFEDSPGDRSSTYSPTPSRR